MENQQRRYSTRKEKQKQANTNEGEHVIFLFSDFFPLIVAR